MQCPPDYVGSTALTALGSVLGRRIGIAPDRQTDWFEVPNLWQCAVGRPGAMKTPAIGEALKPLHRLEVKAREKYDAEAVDYGKALYEWKLRKDAAEAQAKADLKKNPEAKVSFDIAEPQAPIERRYITNDTTYEKLGEILAQNPNGVLAHRDELVSLLKTLDREEYAAARGFFLTAWGGKERYTFDRIGRGRVHIEGACLSMIGSTQPGRLAEYVRRAVTGTSGDDGLIQRFGLLVWPDQSPAWEHVDRYPLSEAREQAWRTFDSFDSLDPGAVGAHPISEYGGIPVLRLDAEAQDLFLEWRKGLERRLRSPDSEMTPALESHFAKYRKLVPSLALINHLADVGHGPVGREAMARALGLATYLETHATRAYGAGPEAETAAAKAILSHIRKGEPQRTAFPQGTCISAAGQTWLIEIRCRLASTFSAIWTGSGGGEAATGRRAANNLLLRSTRGHFDDQLSEQIPGDAEDRFWQKAPTQGTFKTFKTSVLRVLTVRRIGPFQIFHPPTMPRGCPAGAARAATRASSGAGPSSTRTMIPAAGSAGSAPLRPRAVAPATFAACPRTTNDDFNG